jgi:hypothetical protein
MFGERVAAARELRGVKGGVVYNLIKKTKQSTHTISTKQNVFTLISTP